MSTTSTLSRSISAAQTYLPIHGTSTIFPQQGGVVSIGSEQIKYTASSENILYGCTCGFNSTSAATAAQGAVVTLLSTTSVYRDEAGAAVKNVADPSSAQDAATKHYVDNIVESTFLGSLAADPGSPTEGQIWYNTTTHLLKLYNGTAIKTVTVS